MRVLINLTSTLIILLVVLLHAQVVAVLLQAVAVAIKSFVFEMRSSRVESCCSRRRPQIKKWVGPIPENLGVSRAVGREARAGGEKLASDRRAVIWCDHSVGRSFLGFTQVMVHWY